MRESILLIFFLSVLSACGETSQVKELPMQAPAPIDTSVESKEPITYDTISETDSTLTNDYLTGKFDYTKHPLFEKASASISNREIYLRKETIQAFTAMHDSAAKENVALRIVSGTRSFEEQKAIWERKWKKESPHYPTKGEIARKILEYSSMPSTSRHHWGTDIDINSVETAYFQTEKGLAEYNWLAQHAHDFGFYQTYTPKDRGRTGYSVEEWHWSYLPIANRCLELYNQRITNQDLQGFLGCEAAVEIDVVREYVNGIEKY